MESKLRRELMLFGLPIVLLSGTALWKATLSHWSGFGAPAGLYEGKPRLEIVEWRRETPTAWDYSQGLSSQWKVTTWHAGACPGGSARYQVGVITSSEHLVFWWKRAGQWHQTPAPVPPIAYGEGISQIRITPAKHETQLKLPLDLVPHDAEEVRLRGNLDGYIGCPTNTARPEKIRTPSALFDVLLKAPGQTWPSYKGSRSQPLKLVGTKQEWFPVKSLPPSFVVDVTWTFAYSGKNKIDLGGAGSYAWITDAQGKRMPISSHPDYYFTEGKVVMHESVYMNDLRKYRGPFTLTKGISLDKAGSLWPAQVSVPLKLVKATKNNPGNIFQPLKLVETKQQWFLAKSPKLPQHYVARVQWNFAYPPNKEIDLKKANSYSMIVDSQGRNLLYLYDNHIKLEKDKIVVTVSVDMNDLKKNHGPLTLQTNIIPDRQRRMRETQVLVPLKLLKVTKNSAGNLSVVDRLPVISTKKTNQTTGLLGGAPVSSHMNKP